MAKKELKEQLEQLLKELIDRGIIYEWYVNGDGYHWSYVKIESEVVTIEQNAGENRIEGGMVSVSGSVDKSADECNPRICEKCFAENCIGCHKNDMFKAKPTIRLRPYKDCDELFRCYCEKLRKIIGFDTIGTVLDMPPIWVKSKRYKVDNLITAFDNDNESIGGSCVFLQDTWFDMQELLDCFTFLDGSPCGLEE